MLKLELIVQRGEALQFFHSPTSADGVEDISAVGLFHTWLMNQQRWLDDSIVEVDLDGDEFMGHDYYTKVLRKTLIANDEDPFGDNFSLDTDNHAKISDDPKDSILLPGSGRWLIVAGATFEVGFTGVDAPADGERYHVQLRAASWNGPCDTSWTLGNADGQQPIQSEHLRGIVARIRTERTLRSLVDLHPEFYWEQPGLGGGLIQLVVVPSSIKNCNDLWLFEIDTSSVPPGLSLAGGHLTLRLDSVIDPPLAIESCWLIEPGFAPPLYGPSSRLPNLPPFASFLAWTRLCMLFSHLPGSLLAQRRSLYSDRDRLTRARDFFTALDQLTLTSSTPEGESTHGDLTSTSADDALTHNGLGRRLSYGWTGRAVDRMSASEEGDSPDGAEDYLYTSVEGREFMGLVGQSLLDLLTAHFSVRGVLSFGRVETAFVQFASAQLEVDQDGSRLTEGMRAVFQGQLEPDGVMMFCFAELACRMGKLSDHVATWDRLKTVFGIASEVFVRSYHKEGGPRRVCAYTPQNNDRGSRQPTAAELDDIRMRWEAADADSLLGDVILAAIWEDLTEDEPEDMMDVPDFPHSLPV